MILRRLRAWWQGRSPDRASGVSTAGRPVDRSPEGLIGELRGYIASDVRGGYETLDDIAGKAVDVVCEDHDRAWLQQQAVRIVEDELRALREDQAGWPEVTDCDRLDRAFAALEDGGIVCRQNFSCCGTCGVAEIGDEMSEAAAAGREVRGYAFFHMQDTEGAVDGHGLYLNYGATADGEAAALGVGHDIVRAIEAAGLRTDWDGSMSRRIGVTLDWKRRRLEFD